MRLESVCFFQSWSFPGALVLGNCILRETGSVPFFFFELLPYGEILRTKTVADITYKSK